MCNKKYYVIFLIGFAMLLSGCGSLSSESKDTSDSFTVLESEKYMVDLEYQVSNLDQAITIYFPIITNKAITNTELGGVGANLPINSKGLKVKLKPDIQDKLNEEYNDYYISFLKYKVEIENPKIAQVNDCIELCDTKLWIYHDTEFETVEFINSYFRINIVTDDNIAIPDWEVAIDAMQDSIKRNLT